MLILAMVTQQSWAEGARGAAKAALAPLEEGMTQLASAFDRATAALGGLGDPLDARRPGPRPVCDGAPPGRDHRDRLRCVNVPTESVRLPI
jgi:hypothetical protein